MGFDLNKCYSHPGKLLKVHLENVALSSKRFTSSNIKYIDNQLVTVIKIQMICKCKYKTI